VKIFKADYAGTCSECQSSFRTGTEVAYLQSTGELIAACCINSEIAAADAVASGGDFDSFTPGHTPGIAVLPRGKTKKDMCPSCFIVHSPGQNGCE
jgi:hypothetical protein